MKLVVEIALKGVKMINPSDIQTGELALSKYLEKLITVSPEDISTMPDRPGVYFLFSRDELCYIGGTNSLCDRVTSSHSAIKKMKGDLDRIGYVLASKYFVKTLEASCIETFNPSLNKINNGPKNPAKAIVDKLEKFFDQAVGRESYMQSLRHPPLDEWGGLHKVQSRFDVSLERAEWLMVKLSSRAVDWGDGPKVKLKDAEEYLSRCHAKTVAAKKLRHEIVSELGFFPKGASKFIPDLKEEECLEVPLDFESIWQINKARLS